MTLSRLKSEWRDDPQYHKHVHETLSALVRLDEQLNEHRQWVRSNIYGFGEDSFHWVWKLILADLPPNPALIECGVFKGQILSLWKMIREDAKVFGITPLDESGGVWVDDYAKSLEIIHEKFNVPMPHIFKGRTDNEQVMKAATSLLYNVLFVDGDHSFDGCMHDLVTYAPCIKSGGWLVLDDAANRTNQPFGYFCGIDTVSAALAEWENTEIAKDFEWQFNVVHMMVYKRK